MIWCINMVRAIMRFHHVDAVMRINRSNDIGTDIDQLFIETMKVSVHKGNREIFKKGDGSQRLYMKGLVGSGECCIEVCAHHNLWRR